VKQTFKIPPQIIIAMLELRYASKWELGD